MTYITAPVWIILHRLIRFYPAVGGHTRRRGAWADRNVHLGYPVSDIYGMIRVFIPYVMFFLHHAYMPKERHRSGVK